jgi:hypothetical protein
MDSLSYRSIRIRTNPNLIKLLQRFTLDDRQCWGEFSRQRRKQLDNLPHNAATQQCSNPSLNDFLSFSSIPGERLEYINSLEQAGISSIWPNQSGVSFDVPILPLRI